MSSSSTTLPVIVSTPKGYKPLNADGLELANLAAWHLQAIAQSGILAASPENVSLQPLGSDSNPVLAAQRAWITEPPGSVSFDEQSSYAFTGTVQPTKPILTITVPQGFDGVIKWISNNLVGGGVVPAGNVVWQIQVNGRPARNYGNITQEKGTIAQGRLISPLRVFSGDVISYTVQEVVASLTGSTVVSLSGYYYPSKGMS